MKVAKDNHHQYEEGCDPPLAFMQIHNMNKMIILTKQYYIKPYLVGTEKRSLALILPSKLVKEHNINPLTALFLLKVTGSDQLQLIVVRQEYLERIDATDVTSADDSATKQGVDCSS